MAEERQRLDLALVARGLAPSRARAQAAIREGHVRVDGRTARQPSQAVGEGAVIELDAPLAWVSRAALKLEAGLDHFGIAVKDRTCLDLGASTGGFTQVLLARGAARVIAVDVGHGQFAEQLKADPRVTLMEGVNARDLTCEHVPGPVDLIVCDVSFIGLKKALPAALKLAAPSATLIALIKPQFEVGKGRVGKGGIVRDRDLHDQVCRDIEAWLGAQPGWRVLGVCDSPILGGGGNKEFLIAGVRDG